LSKTNVSVEESTTTMNDDRVVSIGSQSAPCDPLTELLREKAMELLQAAVNAECADFLSRFAEQRDQVGRCALVRNGYLPARSIVTGIGPISVSVPRIRDRSGQGIRFESKLVPTYVRRAKSVDAALPWLYLRGLSQADVGPALEALVGKELANVSGAVVGRLKRRWADEYATWGKADLSKERWVYLWVDGIYSGIRAEDHKLCALIVIGVNERGHKRFLAIEDGVRESKQSWREVLIGLKARGLVAPTVAIGDGALGFWSALDEVFPSTRAQRCWVHKTANVLNYLPRSVQPKAKAGLQAIWMAESRVQASKALEAFITTYGAKYPKATECLAKDRDALMTFYDFPAEHWVHLRTSNVIESTFATIRHRTKRVNGAFSRTSLLSMLYKLATCAESSFRRIKGFDWLAQVISGVQFVDGIRQDHANQQQKAAA
jgi:transposase-like protein